MRLPRFRLRTLMIAVAAAGLVLGYVSLRRRSENLRRTSQNHSRLGAMCTEMVSRFDIDPMILSESYIDYSPHPRNVVGRQVWANRAAHHKKMSQKYERAARYP